MVSTVIPQQGRESDPQACVEFVSGYSGLPQSKNYKPAIFKCPVSTHTRVLRPVELSYCYFVLRVDLSDADVLI